MRSSEPITDMRACVEIEYIPSPPGYRWRRTGMSDLHESTDPSDSSHFLACPHWAYGTGLRKAWFSSGAALPSSLMNGVRNRNPA